LTGSLAYGAIVIVVGQLELNNKGLHTGSSLDDGTRILY